MSHSPEPWRISDDGQYVEFADDKYGFYVDEVGGRNTRRVITCANALRGVENPELFMVFKADPRGIVIPTCVMA